MKTLTWKPTLEALEDRTALSGAGADLPIESLVLNLRGVVVADFNNDGKLDLVASLSRLNGQGVGGLGFIEQDNIYKLRGAGLFGMGDGSIWLRSDLVGSAEYYRGTFMIGEDLPDLNARFGSGETSRFQERPPSILIGLLVP